MVAFDPTKVLDPDYRVRAANGYQAILNYVQGRLSAGDYASFLAEAASAGLPTDSDDVLNLPDAARYLDGISAIAFNFVVSAGRHINVNSLSTLAQLVQDLVVGGNLTAATADFQAFAATELSLTAGLIADSISVATTADIGGDCVVGGKVLVGASPTDPGAAGLSAEGRVQGGLLRLLSTVSGFAFMANGELCESSAGDLLYKDQSGVAHSLTRPMHDTGWMNTNPLHACLGVAGGAAATPAQTPDIHAATPLTIAVADPGAIGGAVRIAIWIRVDTSLVEGGAATGNYYYFMTYPFGTAAVAQGAYAFINSVTRQLSVYLGATALVAGQPGIVAGATPSPAIRVMVWTR